MKLSHILIAGTAFLSFGALAEGTKAMQDRQARSASSATSEEEPWFKDRGPHIIRQAQQMLKDAGHNPGPIDGILGPRTEQALKDFQQAQGIEATGELDLHTLASLGEEAAGVGATPGSAPERAVGSSRDSGSMHRY